MSSAEPQSAPRTIVVSGTGGNTLAFTWPAGVFLSPESVFADIDATGAGGPVTATLTIQDQSGVVIAKKRIGETITAGAPGSATWALRLSDDQASSAAAAEPPYMVSLGFTGAGAFNSSLAEDTRPLGGATALYGSSKVSLAVAWTVVAGNSLALSALNRTGAPLIFQCVQLNLTRIDAAGASFYNGNAVIIPNNTNANIPVNTLRFGAAQLNLANPLIPTVVAGGRYVANARISVRP